MDRRRVDRLTVSTAIWFTDDSRRSSGDEEIHGVMDGAGDHVTTATMPHKTTPTSHRSSIIILLS
ncbi:hypothetical protein E4U34_004396 [Claviceps purpurea]|nr:hypothetical protein E4U38_005806 [Claviceps purpurea]KAG6165270.1 hypothetical protein E4U51_004475 [Claviceps purpurea]KAG6174345.1 hypothetical protein E4U27_006530 [Claviceps purpurea]KAG6217888.1 hypothetical protein E4U34_004396 [Claviceps purpurea]KAG6235569.1 hypothetical protein E4U25_004658 [Claviceps purpurea]